MEAHNTNPFHGLKPFGWLALLMAAGIVHANDNCIPTSSANPEVTAASESMATPRLCTPSVARSNAPANASLTTIYKPHITYLGPSASFRKDELTGKSAWEEGHPFSIKRWWDLPESISLTVEERVRYESYATPWMKGNTQGQYGIPIQSVAWFKAKPTDDVRFEVQFWDARQYGSPDPNKLNTTMVNVLNLEQVFTAWINRDIGGSGLDLETKVGQMQMAIGSNRLIGIVPFKSTQFQYVGIQNRLRSEIDDFEWITFANTPEQMLPSTTRALAQNAWVWNRPITDAVFAGTFLDKSLRPHEHLELYFYYLHEGPAQDLSPTLYTPGLRVFKEPQKGSYDYEIETIGQSGWQRITSNTPLLSVGSIMQHVQAGHTFDAPWTPRFLLQWDYASSHFNSLFPSTVSEYGPDGILALFSRNNINTPGYRLFLNPNEDLTFYAANRFWWLADPRATSGWSNANLVDLSGKAGSFVGQTWELNGRWDAHENLALQVGWQILMKGNFARYAPGAPTDQNNVNYWYVQTLVRF